MVSSRLALMALLSVSIVQNASAEWAASTAKIATGMGIAAGSRAALEMIKGNNGNMLEKVTEPATLLVGAALALPFTSYGRVFRAQCGLWMLDVCWWFDPKLYKAITGSYENDTQLLDAVEGLYATKKYPLVSAHNALSSRYEFLDNAIDLIEAALDDETPKSARTKELEAWLDTLYVTHERITYVLRAIKKDPRWTAMLQTSTMEQMATIMARPQIQTQVVYKPTK